MTPNHELAHHIQEFSIDEGQPAWPYEARLAAENGWTVGYARGVVDEYRRFLYLVMTAGQAVTPSVRVDQAWHLHLTYTRSYRDRLWTDPQPPTASRSDSRRTERKQQVPQSV